MKVFSSTPFLRILPTSLAGILTASFINLQQLVVGSIGVCCLLTLLNAFYYPKKWFKNLWHFTLDAALFLLFCLTTTLHNVQRFDDALPQEENQVNYFLVQPLDIPAHYAKQARVKLLIKAIWKNNHWYRVNEKSMGICPTNTDLKAKILYAVRGYLHRVSPAASAADFDYQGYLLNHDIRFNLNVKSFTACAVLSNFQSNCLSLKAKIIAIIRSSGMSNRVAGIAIALVTGYSKIISAEDSEAFTVTGTLHILSVSGLHIGLIYAVASFFMRLVVRDARKKRFIALIPLLLIWGFSFMVGAAPPVLRSSIMCSLLAIAKTIHKRYTGNQVNVLLFSAFILLVSNPNDLFDTGFQLSYTAMLGIFLFQPPLEAAFNFKNRILRYLNTSVCTSIAATLGTLPLNFLLFHQFPPLFILANLAIVPLSFALLLLSLLLLLGVPFSSILLSFGTNWMLTINQLLAQWGCLRFIPFTGTDAVLLTLLELTCLYVCYNPTYPSWRRLVYSVILCLLLNASSFIYNYYCPRAVLLYSQNGFVINVINGASNKVFVSQTVVSRKLVVHCLQKSNKHPVIIRNWSKLVATKNAVKWINNKRQLDYAATWLIDTFHPPDEGDLRKFKPKTIVLVKRLKQRKITDLRELCTKFGCRLIDATKEGTIILDL